jgi:uncharacterized protein (DUF488 family)
MSLRIHTIGHSTRPIADFLEMLIVHGMRRLVDVRTVPRSGHNPQYGKEGLSVHSRLRASTISICPVWAGLRRPRPDSINLGWRNTSFRGYADFMQTLEFAKGLDVLVSAAAGETTAIMCAEAVPWRCHRSLIADALIVRGIEVVEIQSVTNSSPLTLHPWAHMHGLEITYPSESGQGMLDLQAGMDAVQGTEER